MTVECQALSGTPVPTSRPREDYRIGTGKSGSQEVIFFIVKSEHFSTRSENDT